MDPLSLTQPHLRVVHADSSRPDCIHPPGSTILGLREYEVYHFELLHCRSVKVYVDDVELLPDQTGRFEWRPGFVAGQVEIVVQEGTKEFVFDACVEASNTKLRAQEFEIMADEVQRFRAALLLDTSGATRQFGIDSCESGLPMLAKLVRLITYAPPLLLQVRAICRAPHRKLLPTQRRVPLSQVKRISASALRDPRIAAVTGGQPFDNIAIATLHITSPSLISTFDTPTNRALKALLTKVATQASALLPALKALRLGADQKGQQQRRPRREAQLQAILDDIQSTLRMEPFASVSRIETTSAGLTQIAGQPAYSSAYRNAMKALWNGFGGAADQGHLPIRPTWGVYEAWCFVHLMTQLQSRFNEAAWRPVQQRSANAQESYQLSVGSDLTIEVYYQATFPAESFPPGHLLAWSISRQRIPDIIIAVRCGTRYDFIVLDAKFRRRRENVLEAMESAHIYRDSLRVGSLRPAWCLLLLPAPSDVPHLDSADFITEHGVGTISEFSPNGDGVGHCIARIVDWIQLAVK